MRSKKPFFSVVASVMLFVSVAFMLSPLQALVSYAAVSPDKVTSKAYSVPNGTSLPWGTAYNGNGKIWVAMPGCDPNPTCNPTPAGNIAVFDPASSSWKQVINLPSDYSQAFFLAFDKNGNVWFPLPMSNSIGKYNIASKQFKRWTVPTANAGPWDLAIDSQGIVWFTEHFTNKIGSFNPNTQQFTEIPTPAQNSQPYGITIDAHGNKWFTENNSSVALIGEYTKNATLLEYKIRNSHDSNLTPHLITVDYNGNIWWSEGFVGEIARLMVSQAQPGTNNGVTEYAYPQPCGCGTHTSGIGVDSKGNVWFDDSLEGIFGFFPVSGTGSFKVFNAPDGAHGHPHDGLMVDPQNRVWFDEEFANKLALATKG
jgi:streptogramin lyase